MTYGVYRHIFLHKVEKICVSSGLQDEGHNPFDAVSRNKAEDSGFICWRHKTSIAARSNKANLASGGAKGLCPPQSQHAGEGNAHAVSAGKWLALS